ncbi:hypothetical protein [Streptomyces sp. cg40]|uniref:hypothetical protein n=1 Tax=Streptomyces sp. cg40 TaxID=3419764 RepID=UPI003D08BCEB
MPAGDNLHVGLRTSNGNCLTAVGGGGQGNANAIHSDATLSDFGSWEEFQLSCVFVWRAFDPRTAEGVLHGGERPRLICASA